MRDAEVALLGVKGLVEAFGAGKLTPVDAVEAYAARIGRYNAKLNAFLSLRIDAALEEARVSTARWRKEKPLSPLDGIPYGVKANIAVNGLPWHAGISAYGEQIADDDAACIKNLSQGGAIPLGILSMHEGALGATTDNAHFGKCFNPWSKGLTPGGSSGGSGATVAAGLCAFSLGTDTMGSVRIPSAYCGVAGHKPTYGLIPGGGLIDLSPTLDHIGPHARSVEDILQVMPVLADRPVSSAQDGIRIGVAQWSENVDVTSEVAEAFEEARKIVERMGETVPADLSGFDFGAFRRKGLLVSEVEGYAVHEERLAQKPDGFSKEFRGLLEWGARQPQEKVDAAYEGVHEAGGQLANMFDALSVDVIMTPTAPQGPFDFAEPVPANQADFTAMANFAGLPSTALPATTEGAPPASVQFIARKGKDDVALATAQRFEAARGAAPLPPGYF